MPKITLVVFLALFIFSSCVAPSPIESDLPAVLTEKNVIAEENYLDKIIFLGESTTYHLKSRGVLSGGTNTTQVWGPKSGTLMLDASISDCRIIYPESKEELALCEALKKKQPEYMMLTFGLNGATNFISHGSSYFKYCYQKLIDLISQSSPKTKIIINSCFPVAKNMDMKNYTIDAKTLNSYINTINGWAKELAEQNGVYYTDSSSAIKDNEGYLDSKYQVEDGFHLNANAYRKILQFIKENPYKE